MRVLARLIWRALVTLALWRSGWLRRRRPRRGQVTAEIDPSEREVGARPGAVRLVIAVLLVSAIAGVAFTVLFILEPQTQLLGIALGCALASFAIALMVAGRFVVPQETKVEERPELHEPEVVREVTEQLRSGLDGVTRRRLLGTAALATGTGLTAAAVVPVVALGPRVDNLMRQSGWHRGRRVVDDQHKPIAAADIVVGSFVTGFPEGGNFEELGSPIVIVRVYLSELKLPKGREEWAPEGLIAYSKICTHAGCAISLFRWPLNKPTSPGPPALVCPCHYSTFDVLDGASVEFGPAGRPLPQLPLMIDSEGYLRAAGRLSGPVGPSWWGDKE